jgi:hypothetical protein
MRRATAVILGLLLGSNGVWMLAAPANWYLQVPGVVNSGPANLHFIRDIGAAYLIGAVCLVWLAVQPQRAWPAAVACAMFLTLHALLHVWDTVAGPETSHQLFVDLPGVVLPAIVALWLAWPSYHLSKGVTK